MGLQPFAMILVAGLGSTCVFAQTGSALVDGTRTSIPTPVPPTERRALSPEERGDIFMARKMYREAIDTFREGPPKDPILHNKQGIAYHQLLQLDQPLKEYQVAVKLKP